MQSGGFDTDRFGEEGLDVFGSFARSSRHSIHQKMSKVTSPLPPKRWMASPPRDTSRDDHMDQSHKIPSFNYINQRDALEAQINYDDEVLEEVEKRQEV